MKIFLKTVLLSFLIVPLVSSASIPAFPMTFWGEVSVDSAAAPAGSIVRVYAEAVEVGQITVTEAGVYGYTEPTKQKLIVGEGVGVLKFTIETPSVNNGVETEGSSVLTHAGFVSSETFQKNLAFVIAEPVSRSSGGGGGGGGSSREKVDEVAGVEELVLGISTTTPFAELSEEDKKIELQKQIIEILTQIIVLLKQKMLLG